VTKTINYSRTKKSDDQGGWCRPINVKDSRPD